MTEPLTLQSVSALGTGEFDVLYTYRKRATRCNGHSIVTIEPTEGRNLIAHIKPVGNC